MASAADHKAFEAWYQRVDHVVLSIAGLGIDDLPDGNSWDAWESGASPLEYAQEQLEAEGFPFDDGEAD